MPHIGAWHLADCLPLASTAWGEGLPSQGHLLAHVFFGRPFPHSPSCSVVGVPSLGAAELGSRGPSRCSLRLAGILSTQAQMLS